jgi:hypothetical protein
VRRVRQVLHLLRKDLFLVRGLLGAYAGLVLVRAALETEPLMGDGRLYVLVLLGVFLLAILVLAVALQADPLRGPRATWRTLPISASALAASKLLLALLMVGMGVAAAELPWLLAVGTSDPGADFRTVVGSAAGSALLLGIVAMVALVTPNLRTFAVALVVLWVGWGVLGVAIGRGLPGRESPAVEVTRPLLSDVPMELRLADLEVRALPTSPRDGEGISVNLAAPSTPPEGFGYVLVEPSLVLREPQGSPTDGKAAGEVRALVTPPVLTGDSIRWLGAATPGRMVTSVEVPLPLPEHLEPRSWPPGVSVDLRGRVEVLRPDIVARSQLEVRTLRSPERLIRILDWEQRDGEPRLRVRVREGRVAAPATRTAGGFEWGFARRGRLAFALYHPARREAVRLLAYPRTTVGAGTGGRTIVWLELSPADGDIAWTHSGPEARRLSAVPPGWLDEAELLVFEWVAVGAYEMEVEVARLEERAR